MNAETTASGPAAAGPDAADGFPVGWAAVLVAFRLAWLMLATYVGVWLACYNPDPLFRQAIGP